MSGPLVFDLTHGSWVDGPGLRSVVFLKGCPLRCAWCHNPEGQRLEPETLLSPEKCLHCGRCAEGCFSGARRPVGRWIAPDRLASLLSRNRVFFEATGGGVTFSGGEPLLFLDYVGAAARALARQGIAVAIETAGLFDLSRYREVLEDCVDLVLFDLKLLDDEAHRRWTGVGNATILRNLEALAADETRLVLRVPLVPEITATEENLCGIARFARRLGIDRVQLLPYNPTGLEKARRLEGRPSRSFPDALERPMSLEEETHWRRLFAAAWGTGDVPLTASASTSPRSDARVVFGANVLDDI